MNTPSCLSNTCFGISLRRTTSENRGYARNLKFYLMTIHLSRYSTKTQQRKHNHQQNQSLLKLHSWQGYRAAQLTTLCVLLNMLYYSAVTAVTPGSIQQRFMSSLWYQRWQRGSTVGFFSSFFFLMTPLCCRSITYPEDDRRRQLRTLVWRCGAREGGGETGGCNCIVYHNRTEVVASVVNILPPT